MLNRALHANRIVQLATQIRASYWFIPVCMMLSSLAVCYAFIAVSQRAALPEWLQTLIPLTGLHNAQQLLSTIATAIITATSIAFSMTIVALTMASSQFGPRLLRTFMMDRSTQWILGLLVSSFVFCMVALHQLGSLESKPDAIAMLCAAAVLVIIIDVLGIIFFLHHIARFIQADQVIHRCYRDFQQDTDSLLAVLKGQHIRPISPQMVHKTEFCHTLVAPREGYVQRLDYDYLIDHQSDRLAGIETCVRGGDYVAKGADIMRLYGRCNLTESDLAKWSQSISFGSKRTPVQDPEFAISQLVEIALRALSPGINDPFTAMTCLDKLSSACIELAKARFPEPVLVNTRNDRWLVRRTFDLNGVVDTAFDQIRHAAANKLDVCLYLLTCLRRIDNQTNNVCRETLFKQAHSCYFAITQQALSEADRQQIDQAFVPFSG